MIPRWLLQVWYSGGRGSGLLLPLTWVYRSAIAVRRWLYRHGIAPVVELSVPVVVVGNLTVGGTGKTPLVLYLARALTMAGRRPGIVSRGYGGKAGRWPQRVSADSDPAAVGDEPVLLARRSGCPVAVDPDRVAAARLLLEEGVDVILADDGLQHYRLGRGAELAIVDGQRGLGNGRCLPAGPLREPPARLDEVTAVVVHGPGWERPGALRMDLAAGDAHSIASEERRPLSAFAGRPVHAIAGIGHPERFFRTLAEAGLEVIPHPMADHAPLGPGDLAFDDGLPVLMTEKDAVKCGRFAAETHWYVPVEAGFGDAARAQLLQILGRACGESAAR